MKSAPSRHRIRQPTIPHAWRVNTLVARPVSKLERKKVQAAQIAVNKEWQKLREKEVWDESQPMEWDEVRKWARDTQTEVHMAYLFDICVEKNSEDPSTRKYKGRVVFQGNHVMNHLYEDAQFQDMGSAPATLEN